MVGHIADQELLRLVNSDGANCDDPIGDVIEHLDNCDTCQIRLASLSGEGSWLADVKEVLDQEPFESRWPSGPPSVSIILNGTQSDEEAIDATRVKLDFLESPRHPELLGRLGRYDIERLVGVGGFGIVFKAHDSELHRTVALKVLSPHLMTSGAARMRFAREAQAAAAIHHENVIPIFDVMAEERVVYLVMPFIAGSSLQERVDRDGPLLIDEILRVGVQMAAGLAAAHKQGLVHRDVKPANVLLESSLDRVVISDFGLARTADDASLTRSGVITGTPHYMSPEQAIGDPMDARSDLFSLGSVLYFMCTGRPPFRAPQVLAVLNQINQKEPRSIEATRKDIPFELQTLIDRLLKKSPSKRFASAGDVSNELTSLLNAHQNGRLRRRRPALKRYAGKLAMLAAVVSTVAFVGYGVYQIGFVNSQAKESKDADSKVGVLLSPSPDPATRPVDPLLSDSFDAIAAETETVLSAAEVELQNAEFLEADDVVWRTLLDEAETALQEAESLFERSEPLPLFENGELK